jgi:hypothetical protein
MNGMLQPNNAFNFQYYQPSTGRYIDPSLMDADEVSRQAAGWSELIPASQAPQSQMPMMPMMPMYQPQPPTDGISSAVSQISGGMGDEYTNRLLSALGLGDVSQYEIPEPMSQPMPYYNPYMNPYAGMFSPFMQQPSTADLYYQSQINPSSGTENANPGVGTGGSYGGSQFGRDLGFGLMSMPFSPVANMLGHALTGIELEAIAKEFENLPTVTGDGESSMGSGVSPTGDDVEGTPF